MGAAYGGAVQTTTLSEAASTALLAAHGVTFARQQIVASPAEASAAATTIGFPVVVKLNGDRIAHKTERGLVRLNVASAAAAETAATELLAAATPADGEVTVLVAQQVRGNRELICGLLDDPVFGPTVMCGVGGILAEAVADVVFRLAPITRLDALEMLDDLATQALLGAFRGEPAVDREALAAVLVGLGEVAAAHPHVRSVDLNPVIIVDGKPVAVDALVEVSA